MSLNYRGWDVSVEPSGTGRSVKLSPTGTWYGVLMRTPSRKTLTLYYYAGATDEHLSHGKAWMGAILRGDAPEFEWRRRRNRDGTYRFTTGIGTSLDTDGQFAAIAASLDELRDLYAPIPELLPA